jgi:flavorubredoxin
VPQLESDLREAGFDVVPADLAVRWAPSAEELQRAREFGRTFARQVQRAGAGPASTQQGSKA